MKGRKVYLVFPHQLFSDVEPLMQADAVYLVEEYLFFRQYKFHKQKLVMHRSSMKYYEQYLRDKGLTVHYIEASHPHHDVRELLRALDREGTEQVHCYDVCDNWLEKRIQRACKEQSIVLQVHESPSFINTRSELASYFGSNQKFLHNDFYIQQRKKLGILLDAGNKPLGGKWSFDADNRVKYPKGKTPPRVQFPPVSAHYREAMDYVEQNFASNYGNISSHFIYPTTHEEAREWLSQFLEQRFHDFGAYEDAIVEEEHVLHHSLLTPMLNTGLLTPMQVVREALDYGLQHEVPLNSLEGFIRQIIGWREFIRGVYLYRGNAQRTTNYWNFRKKIPASFYTGTTGITPIDVVIKKTLETGYCHHIERLMLLGNMMLLSEFHPDEVYRWFMELFIDAYDWVMVPNVYGMSQFADGGLMATKPYISGSSYVLKMSNHKKGSWCDAWDALFWHFMHKQRSFFSSNPRLGMLLATFDKMDEEKRNRHLANANDWINSLPE